MATVTLREIHSKHRIYTVQVYETEISVTVTASASVVKRWLYTTLYFRRRQVYRRKLVVGLGVQWTPGGADPPPDTLQLCVGRRCLIFQLAQSNYVPRKLRTFLGNPWHSFVGFWNHSDRRKLERSKHGLEMVTDPLDLRLYAKTVDEEEDLTQASVEEIIEECLGFEVDLRREISTSDWGEKCLSHGQVAYATTDAYCAFLMGWNKQLGEDLLSKRQ